MHTNPAFRKATETQNIDAARNHGFGILCINHDAGPMVSHVPFILSADGTLLEAHLTRSNPILRAIETPQPAVMAIEITSGYISPDWYGAEDQVPTYNYIAIHLRGLLRRESDTSLRPHLEALSQHFERKLAPKPIWKIDKMTPDVVARMTRMIVPVAMDITDIDGTWKLGQNKETAHRLAAADRVGEAQLADLMREPPA